MVNFLRRKLPVTIVFVMGMLMIIRFYCPRQESDAFLTEMSKWITIISGFTLVIGIISLMKVHYNRMRRKHEGWGFSLVMYVSLFATILVGLPKHVGSLALGLEAGSPFMWIFDNLNAPVSSAMFSLLGFYVASAAYRAFRAKSFEAAIMLTAAVIVMFGRIPVADLISEPLPEMLKITNLTSWILNVPTVAARRAVLLGMGLGSIATALKIIFGLERTYMGGGD